MSAAAVMQPFVWTVRVYYEDTDSTGVVYYANYLRFFERARTEWLRALGFEQTTLAAEQGVLFVIAAVSVDYLRPSLFNDVLQVTVEADKVGAGYLALAQRILRDGEVLTAAKIKVACVGARNLRPVRIPRVVIDSMGKTL